MCTSHPCSALPPSRGPLPTVETSSVSPGRGPLCQDPRARLFLPEPPPPHPPPRDGVHITYGWRGLRGHSREVACQWPAHGADKAQKPSMSRSVGRRQWGPKEGSLPENLTETQAQCASWVPPCSGAFAQMLQGFLTRCWAVALLMALVRDPLPAPRAWPFPEPALRLPCKGFVPLSWVERSLCTPGPVLRGPRPAGGFIHFCKSPVVCTCGLTERKSTCRYSEGP